MYGSPVAFICLLWAPSHLSSFDYDTLTLDHDFSGYGKHSGFSSDFSDKSEDNRVLIIFGKTDLLSNIILLDLNNIVKNMTPYMAKKTLVDIFDPIIDKEGPFLRIQPQQRRQGIGSEKTGE
jgi:hypothetical protein